MIAIPRFWTVGAIAGAALLFGLPAGAIETELSPLVRITGPDPLLGCIADRPGQQDGTFYTNSEIEPWVEVNPANPDVLIAGWQQDRWSNGGSRGLVSARSADGGETWTTVLPLGTTLCLGGQYTRASDPWVSFAPNGVSYFMHLVFQPDLPTGGFGANAMLVSRSTNGGQSWGPPIVLRRDTNPQVLNDKNSLTADPNDSNFAYAVWDRLRDFTIPPAGARDAARQRLGMDGVAIARERARRLLGAAESPEVREEPIVFFKGPTFFTRTINGGKSWEPTRVIYDPGPNAQTIGNLIAVLPNGTVIDFFDDIAPNGTPRLGYLRSFNKGRTFETIPHYVSVMATSLTGTLTPNLQEPVRDASFLFDVAVDPNGGAIYLVWQDVRFRGVDEVAFSRSTDGGETWSIPIRINRTPASTNLLRQQAFVPSVAVAGDGTIAVTYYDFRFDTGSGGELTDHWAVLCRPSEADCTRRASWTTELRLTTRSFDMLHAPVAIGLFLGDYVGLTAAGDSIWPVFGIADGVDRTSLFVRRITLPGAVLMN